MTKYLLHSQFTIQMVELMMIICVMAFNNGNHFCCILFPALIRITKLKFGTHPPSLHYSSFHISRVNTRYNREEEEKKQQSNEDRRHYKWLTAADIEIFRKVLMFDIFVFLFSFFLH